MKKICVCAGLGLMAATFSSGAMAQFGGLKGLTGSSSSSAGSVSAESLVKSYVSGTKNVLTAQSSLSSALGLKDAADRSALQAKNLTEGATTSDLEGAAKVQTESSKQIQDTLNGGSVTLDANGKKEYAKGLLGLAKGIKDYLGMSGDVKNFKPAGMSALGGAATAALFVVKDLPGSTSNLVNTLKSAIDFARKNNIEVPTEATSVL